MPATDWSEDIAADETERFTCHAEFFGAFEMRVQFYEDATQTPIEDPTVEWKTPWVTIARLTLPKQDPDSPRGKQVSAYVEQMSFDPWHAREDLRPLGSLMRARNHAYRVSTQRRGAIAEPTTLPSFDA